MRTYSVTKYGPKNYEALDNMGKEVSDIEQRHE